MSSHVQHGGPVPRKRWDRLADLCPEEREKSKLKSVIAKVHLSPGDDRLWEQMCAQREKWRETVRRENDKRAQGGFDI